MSQHKNPNYPFDRHPGHKLKTVPMGTFKNAFTDEVMPELSIAVRTFETHQGLPAFGKNKDGEYPEGSGMWYTEIYNKYRNDSGVNGVYIPARENLKDFVPCEPSNACPHGVAKKQQDNDDIAKPILTVSNS